MELQENTPLNLPLFRLDDNLAERDMEQPDLTLEVILDANLLANLCQNPAPEQSVSIPLESYQISNIEQQVAEVLSHGHQAQLLLNHGPVLSAVLSCESQAMFVSPPMEMMPTFDLGLDDEDDEEGA
ncbi:hypothetical protein [Pseudoalteromonas sp. R3]|uniref:hypothetical protein n=1 Tax=Pseudoalteromonas sp. R3 TaxID=1709477 RepID=UPI0006B5AD94|nr:hypothetical protein [Pseudoalteromonas sp. R3]AZZ99831.1 hypothetical protein ELR70_23830 [Pseudoalteromonas sp. R3]